MLSALIFIAWFVTKGREYKSNIKWVPIHTYRPFYRSDDELINKHIHEQELGKKDVNMDDLLKLEAEEDNTQDMLIDVNDDVMKVCP